MSESRALDDVRDNPLRRARVLALRFKHVRITALHAPAQAADDGRNRVGMVYSVAVFPALRLDGSAQRVGEVADAQQIKQLRLYGVDSAEPFEVGGYR